MDPGAMIGLEKMLTARTMVRAASEVLVAHFFVAEFLKIISCITHGA